MGTKIMGKPTVKMEYAKKFVQEVAPNAPENVVETFYMLGEIEGVRPDIALAQSLKETGNFEYGGDVKPEQNNFAGIGAVGGGAEGSWFRSVAYGALAQIHHLKAYASTEEKKLKNHSPRSHFVQKGIAPTVEELAGRWAVPGYETDVYDSLEDALLNGDAYGDQIMDIVTRMEIYQNVESTWDDDHDDDVPDMGEDDTVPEETPIALDDRKWGVLFPANGDRVHVTQSKEQRDMNHVSIQVDPDTSIDINDLQWALNALE